MEQTPLVMTPPTPRGNPMQATLIGGVLFLILSLAATLYGATILLPIFVLVISLALYGLWRFPLALLSTLIVVRMSLDYSSQFLSLELLGRSVTLSQLLGLGIALLGVIFILFHGSKFSHFPLLLPYSLIILWGLGTLFYSISPLASLQELLRVFDLLVVGFIAYASVERYRDFRVLIYAIFISSILPILFGLYQFLFGIGLSDESVSALRIFGTFSHPNVFSLYLFTVAAVGVIYFIVYARQDRARLFTGLYLGLVLLTLLVTYARIAWVALFVFALFLALWRYRFLILPMVLLPIVLTTFVPAVGERVAEAFHPGPDSSIVWRKNLWHDMLLKTRLEDRTYFGSGLDTFRISTENLRGQRFGSTDAHNDFVKFYVDGGLVGLGVFVLYLMAFTFPAFQARRLTPSHSLKNMATLILILCLTLIIASLSDNVFKNTPVQWILAIVMGGFLSLYRLSQPKQLLS